MLAWWTCTALAGGVAGTSVPGAGGGFAGVSEPGALGIIYAPAAAAHGEGPELLIDIGVFRRTLIEQLDDWDEPLPDREWAPQPSAALAIPLGRAGVGFTFWAPSARGGQLDPKGPQRFFTINSTIQLLEMDAVAAVRVHDQVTLGGGLRVGQLTYWSDKATDTAKTLNAAFDTEPPFPEGDPLFEGQQRVGSMSGFGASWVASARVELPADIELHAAFRPPWTVNVSGPIELEPSNDLNTVVGGRAVVELPFPMSVAVAGRIGVGRLTFIPEIEYVGWRAAGFSAVTLKNLALSSDDVLFNSILNTSGLAEADFLTSNEGRSQLDLGWRNVVNPGIQAEWAPTDETALRLGFWHSPAAIVGGVTPSNVDFETQTVRLAGSWRPAPQLGLSVAADRLFSPTRVITDSPGTATTPAGNGVYDLSAWRFGLTLRFLVPTKEEV